MIDTSAVVDASVALKWVLAEDFSDKALALLTQAGGERRLLRAPPHFPGEIANAIYQRLRSRSPQRHLDEAEADEAFETLFGILNLDVEIVSPPDLYDAAYRFAKANGLPSVYDAMYVTLAQNLGSV